MENKFATLLELSKQIPEEYLQEAIDHIKAINVKCAKQRNHVHIETRLQL